MPTLAELCSEMPVTISVTSTLEAALTRLLMEDVTELYVIDADRRLLGIVPDFELLKARLNGSWQQLTVAQVMSPRVLCFHAETLWQDALKQFREGHHAQAAVVRDGELIGLVTRKGLLRNLCSELEAAVPRPNLLRSELARNATTLRELSYA